MMGCRENRPAVGVLGQIATDFMLFHKKMQMSQNCAETVSTKIPKTFEIIIILS